MWVSFDELRISQRHERFVRQSYRYQSIVRAHHIRQCELVCPGIVAGQRRPDGNGFNGNGRFEIQGLHGASVAGGKANLSNFLIASVHPAQYPPEPAFDAIAHGYRHVHRHLATIGQRRIQNKGLSVGMLREILLRAPEEKRNGKLLVKLNPYITDRQKEEYGIKTVSGNLLDDGLLLWNNTNDEWENILSSRFSMIRYTEIYYEEYEQSNRMYLLTKQ